ncbi:MAG: hypothetical protein GY757_52045, partial [bacterium]|nr:hypothetical protein [bacterium]
QGLISDVDIAYSANSGGSWNTIVSATANDGSFSWSVPALDSANCLVRVSSGTTSDVSNNSFTIFTQPSITVTSPNGGEQWVNLTTNQITWSTLGPVGNVKIEYTKNGRRWKLITSSTANDGSYSWYIPNVNKDKTKCTVRITEVSGSAIDTSDTYFTIKN